MARLAIVGSRNFKRLDLVTTFVRRLQATTTVVSGGARGVDTVAVNAAASRGMQVEVFQADWAKYGKSAGPCRNEAMIATVDGVLAFWDGKSSGTKHAIECAKKRGIWLKVITVDDPKPPPPSMDQLSQTRMPFGAFKDWTFDKIPLEYLDWLSGQKWMEYGLLRQKLTAYLKANCIQRELDLLFPDWENDTLEVFFPSRQTTKKFSQGKRIFIDPEEETEQERKDAARRKWLTRKPNTYSEVGAWKMALHLLKKMEDAPTCIDLYAIAEKVTNTLKEALPQRMLDELRKTFFKKKAEFIIEALLPPGRDVDLVLLNEAIEENPALEAVAMQEAPELYQAAQLFAAAPPIHRKPYIQWRVCKQRKRRRQRSRSDHF